MTARTTAQTIKRAERLAQLHADRAPLVGPTVWDVCSARLAVDAGFEALTIGSDPLADSLGAEDNEELAFADVIVAVSARDVRPMALEDDIGVRSGIRSAHAPRGRGRISA